jgi:hypothetical protein
MLRYWLPYIALSVVLHLAAVGTLVVLLLCVATLGGY